MIKKAKQIKILGDGQIWDIEGVDLHNPDKIFEDLFSGRALGELARASKLKIFNKFIEAGKDKVTGVSVSWALASKDKTAQRCAREILSNFADFGARGIELLTKGKAIKEKWTNKERGYWRDLSGVIIGGGVSEENTGRFIVDQIHKDLELKGLGHIKIYQAKFPGKEAGFLGAIAYCLPFALKENHRVGKAAVIGLDIGRADIGVGGAVLNLKDGKLQSYKDKAWFYNESISTPHAHLLHIFKDSYRKYSQKEIKLGSKIRSDLIQALAELIIKAINKVEQQGFICSKYIGIGLPGETDRQGFMTGSTHYLPFLEKKHNFHFSNSVKKVLEKSGFKGYNIQILNDGIAAGLANLRFGIGLEKLKPGKYAFLGPGSGLGGFVGKVLGPKS